MALLIALDYREDPVGEVRKDGLNQVAYNQNFEKFTDFDLREMLRVPKNIANGGIFSGKELESYCQYVIAKRTGLPDMSFAQLHEHIQKAKAGDISYFGTQCKEAMLRHHDLKKRFKQYDADFDFDFDSPSKMMERAAAMKDLFIVASKEMPKNTYTETTFSHQSTEYGDLSIAEGVRASAGFPFVFCRASINGKKFRDGGLTNNYPIEVFDKDENTPNPETLCIGLDIQPLKNKDGTPQPESKKLRNFKKVGGFLRWPIEQTMATFAEHKSKEFEDKKDMTRTILVAVEGDVIDFNLTAEQRKGLAQIGFDVTMEQYLSKLPQETIVAEQAAAPFVGRVLQVGARTR